VRVTAAKLSAAQLSSLLTTQGRLFSDQLGIAVASLRPAELFKWFLASLLFGARISEKIAVRTFRAFQAHNLASVQAVAAANFGELLTVMAEGGYARYDNVTSRKVQEAALKLLAEYGGDLNQLHAAAAEAHDLVERLQAFRGVGPVTASIFLRELRGLWPKADPPPDALAHLAANHLGIEDPRAFWQTNPMPGYDFRHFEVALTRLGRDYCRRHRCAQAPIPHAAPD
jgi:endonuclease III